MTCGEETGRISVLIMRKKSLTYIVAIAFAVVAPWSVGVCSGQEEESVAAQQAARRRVSIQDVMQEVQQARSAYVEKKYTDAVEHYRNALSVLPKGSSTKKLESFIRDSLSDALIARAIDYRSVGRIEEAISFLKEAIEQSPGNARAKQELIYTEDPVRNNPALTPRHVGDVEEVNRLLILANGYLDLGQYDKAEEAFKRVRDYDSTNVAAMQGLERVRERKMDYYAAMRDERRSKMLSEVDKTWDDSMGKGDEPSPMKVGVEMPTEGEPEQVEQEYADLFNNMVIPSFNVEDANITEVIDLLQNQVRRRENSGQKAVRAANIVGAFGAVGSPEYLAATQKRASFRMDNVTVRELLDEIGRHYGVEYNFSPIGVEITLPGRDYGRLEERVFTVPPHFFDEAADEGGDDEEDGFGSGSSGVTVARVNPVAALKRMNISFPPGANAAYHAGSRRLTVRNTLRNLADIEELVAGGYEKTQKLIVLNVMVVETTEDSLEDLGFEWLVNIGPGGHLIGGGGTEYAASNATGMPILSTTRNIDNNMSPVVTEGQRTIRQVVGERSIENLLKRGSVGRFQELSGTEVASPTIFGFRGVWNQADVTMIMRGLSQKGTASTLSTPRLVFAPGSEEQVSLINVREMFYPTNYDEPQLMESVDYPVETTASGDLDGDGIITEGKPVYKGAMAIAVGAQPTDFVRYGVTEDELGGIGSIMQVHNAEVAPDNSSVRLAITTTVNDFEGFVDWGTAINAAMWTDYEAQRVMLAPNHIYQPIFKRYRTNTLVTVEDGAVLVMGGMKEARVVQYEDKVPILGDLPLVGRLFRSSGEERKRKVLLIFAKVNIIDPSGHSIRTREADVSAQAPM